MEKLIFKEHGKLLREVKRHSRIWQGPETNSAFIHKIHCCFLDTINVSESRSFHIRLSRKIHISENIKWPLIFLYLKKEEELTFAAILLTEDCNHISSTSSRHWWEAAHLPPIDWLPGASVQLLLIQGGGYWSTQRNHHVQTSCHYPPRWVLAGIPLALVSKYKSNT